MNAFDTALHHVLDVEGGYVDDPKDSGGETNYGITRRVARRYGYTGPMRDLDVTTARLIYRRAYWEPLELDTVAAINKTLALELFDSGVNCGTRRAAEWLQRALNVLNRNGRDYGEIAVDGDVGPRTVSALRSYATVRGTPGLAVLVTALNALQGAFYITLAERRSKDERFVYGWLRTRVRLL